MRNEKLAFLDDVTFIKFWYWVSLNKFLNLENPKTISEKLQWLKIYNRNEQYVLLADKYAVKEYVADIIGENYIIPTLGVWNRTEDIDFSSLPKKFVLKCTHNSGLGMCICRDKSKLNISDVIRKLNQGLAQNYFFIAREWPYKNVPHRIIAEKFMEQSDGSKDLVDYKFYCFNGKSVLCQVFNNRSADESIDFFDINWQHLELKGMAKPYKKFYDQEIEKPANFNLMVELAEKLARNIPFVRVDFYDIDGNVYFGEMTFFPAGGFGEFYPDKWNYILGDLLDLKDIKN